MLLVVLFFSIAYLVLFLYGAGCSASGENGILDIKNKTLS